MASLGLFCLGGIMSAYVEIENHELLGKRVWIEDMCCTGIVTNAFAEHCWNEPDCLVCMLPEQWASVPINNARSVSIIH